MRLLTAIGLTVRLIITTGLSARLAFTTKSGVDILHPTRAGIDGGRGSDEGLLLGDKEDGDIQQLGLGLNDTCNETGALQSGRIPCLGLSDTENAMGALKSGRIQCLSLTARCFRSLDGNEVYRGAGLHGVALVSVREANRQ
jgi:hypothetical protein